VRNHPLRRTRALRAGVSDLVVILALVAIAIPVALALQGWLGAQASRINSYTATPQISGVVISKSYTSSGQVFVIKLKDTGTYNYSLSGVTAKAILANGSVINAYSVNVASGTTTLQPGTSVTLSVTVNTRVGVKTLVLSLLNENTGKKATVNVNIA